MQVISLPSEEAFIETALEHVRATVQRHPSACIGLSGGSTPRPLYAALAAEKSLDLSRVTFFLLDERYVPADHPESNQAMVRALLCSAGGQSARLLAPRVDLPLMECIADYAEQIESHLPNDAQGALQMDCAILGMGPDGHITSLFPPLTEEAFGPKSVIYTTTDQFAIHDRISLTLPLLINAKERLFLITGKEKIDLLTQMQNSTVDVSRYPAQALCDDRTTWICRTEV